MILFALLQYVVGGGILWGSVTLNVYIYERRSSTLQIIRTYKIFVYVSRALRQCTISPMTIHTHTHTDQHLAQWLIITVFVYFFLSLSIYFTLSQQIHEFDIKWSRSLFNMLLFFMDGHLFEQSQNSVFYELICILFDWDCFILIKW